MHIFWVKLEYYTQYFLGKGEGVGASVKIFVF